MYIGSQRVVEKYAFKALSISLYPFDDAMRYKIIHK